MKINRIITAALIAATAIPAVTARDSRFTRRGAGPMYWMAYEQCFVTDQAISEGRFQQNIDWVAENFKPYGYDMICTDGWIEGGQTINRNGYITKYNSGWEHDLAYWVKYCNDRGLEAGIYYDPMWLTRAAYNTNARVAGRDDVRTQDIVGSTNFNDFIYWVDADKDGAEEWIKGYVNHFKELGFRFLRVDFVNWYENAYGSERYAKCLRWIAEACGDDMLFSLVMPNCWDNSANEVPYADLMRISEDVFGGGFDFVSGRRRGQYQDGWANWGNISDGFAAFSEVSGRGQLIMDGDFIRLNTCETNDERQYWVSLVSVTGSAIAIADQYDTGAGYEEFYQNEELIALNKAGFAARPLSTNVASTSSSRWVGQMPDGSWVVGLFNRDDEPVSMSIRLKRELGLEAAEITDVRDLWAHASLGAQSGNYSAGVPAHGCRVFKVTTTAKRYQAEAAGVRGGATIVY